MRYLWLLILLGVVAWLLGKRIRGPAAPPAAARSRAPAPSARGPGEPMLACAHCGVHLPQSETVADAAGQRYCGEMHRLAGPRGPV